jgi:hypothetical protein
VVAQTEAQAAAKVATIAAYESKSSNRAVLDEALKQARLRSMAGHEPLATSLGEYVYELQQGPAVSLSRNIAANSQFWATPWKTLGGSALLVHPLAKLGRMAAKPAVIRGHASAMTAFVITCSPLAVRANRNASCRFGTCGSWARVGRRRQRRRASCNRRPP